VVEHEHTTLFIALLKSFENAQGKLTTILDADNVFPKTYIEHVMRQINNFSEENLSTILT
jgi:cellulose synthase/poly-beta-1,6-N-acetylglucosamine synthase-like glycosyltransferase